MLVLPRSRTSKKKNPVLLCATKKNPVLLKSSMLQQIPVLLNMAKF